jgi:hypothetical protein
VREEDVVHGLGDVELEARRERLPPSSIDASPMSATAGTAPPRSRRSARTSPMSA